MGRDYDDEESYYDDDEEFSEEFDDQPQDMRSRLAAVLGTSYGISIVVHGIIALLLTLIVLAAPEETKEAVVMAQNQVQEQEYDEEVERAMEKTPKIEAQEVVEKPIIVLEEEVTFENETPKGTDFSNLSNKNLDSTSANDAYGAGGGAAGAYGSRFGKGGLAQEGGSPATESAVRGALRWLMRAQSRDGRWDADDWRHLREHTSEIQGAVEQGMGRYDVGLTGLALLAYLGNGNTHHAGPFKRTVNAGFKWLLTQQEAHGGIGFRPGDEGSIYNHAIATMALCEALAVSGDNRRFRKPAEKAVRFCLDAQNPGFGWKYEPRSGHNDTSVTGWMVLALKAAKSAKLDVPDDAFEAARTWFDAATNAGGEVGYQGPDG
ncbi:MAG: prenyltransferase/squalene oxidase repeat-containing protein, partial [Planctomycetota bacterium]